MRRVLVMTLSILVIGALGGSASARTLRVRLDPNDSTSNLDIHKVITDLSASNVYLRIDSWNRFAPRRMQGEYVFFMDTFGSKEFDRIVEIYGGLGKHLTCLVENAKFKAIGDLHATRSSGRSVACNLPRAWFGHIDRAVRFQAAIGFPPTRRARDHAPDRWVYRWI